VIDRSKTRDTPKMPVAAQGRRLVRDSGRGNHLGQRSCANATKGRTYERKRSDQNPTQNFLRARGRPHMASRRGLSENRRSSIYLWRTADGEARSSVCWSSPSDWSNPPMSSSPPTRTGVSPSPNPSTRRIPVRWASFTDPEYAQVGLSEAKARQTHDIARTVVRFDSTT
jgi:hypothetical protein